MDIEEYERSQQPLAKKEAAYEAACKAHAPGRLSARDVLRLWGDGSHDRAAEGAEARRLIAELDLELMEVGPGNWMVSHSI